MKNRTNIVLYPDGENRDDCVIVRSLDELFDVIKKYDKDRVFVIGGAMMYKTLLPYCDEVLVTKVDAVGGADAYFENLDENPDFTLVYKSDAEETNGYKINFCTYRNENVREY